MSRLSRAASAALLVVSVFSTADVRAEGGQTHGGTAVVCRSPDGKIARAEVLDLFEARELLGVRPMAIEDENWARTAVLWGMRFRYRRTAYFDYLDRAITEFRYRFKLLEPGRHLPLIPDVFPVISKLVGPVGRGAIRNDHVEMQRLLSFDERCAIEQLASFDDDGAILLDREIYDALDPLNRLAIELHEGAYYLDRTYRHATDSAFARRLVGLLLADRPDPRLDSMLANYDFLLDGTAILVPFLPGSER